MSLRGAQRQSNLAPAHQTEADLGADGTDKTIRYSPSFIKEGRPPGR